MEGSNDFPSHICATCHGSFILRGVAWPGEASAGRPELLSVLKGDDRVYSVHVERAVPEHSGEIVCVRRVVEFYLLAESCVLGERVHVSFVINNLDGRRSERGDEDNT